MHTPYSHNRSLLLNYARNGHLAPKHQIQAAQHEDIQLRRELARSLNVCSSAMELLAHTPDSQTQIQVAKTANAMAQQAFQTLSESDNPQVHLALARNSCVGLEALLGVASKLAAPNECHFGIQGQILESLTKRDPKITTYLRHLGYQVDPPKLSHSKQTALDTADDLLAADAFLVSELPLNPTKGRIVKLDEKGNNTCSIWTGERWAHTAPYESPESFRYHQDVSARNAFVHSSHVSREDYFTLSRDAAVEVRLALVNTENTPDDVLQRLTQDASEEVRARAIAVLEARGAVVAKPEEIAKIRSPEEIRNEVLDKSLKEGGVSRVPVPFLEESSRKGNFRNRADSGRQDISKILPDKGVFLRQSDIEGGPSISKVSEWAGAARNQTVYYTGTDLSNDEPTHVFYIDGIGNVENITDIVKAQGKHVARVGEPLSEAPEDKIDLGTTITIEELLDTTPTPDPATLTEPEQVEETEPTVLEVVKGAALSEVVLSTTKRLAKAAGVDTSSLEGTSSSMLQIFLNGVIDRVSEGAINVEGPNAAALTDFAKATLEKLKEPSAQS